MVDKKVRPSTMEEEKKGEGEKFDGYSREYKRGTPEEQERMPYNTRIIELLNYVVVVVCRFIINECLKAKYFTVMCVY